MTGTGVVEIREVGFYDTPGTAHSVFVSGNFAYVADGNRDLRVIDISDPGEPDEVGYYDTPDVAFGVFVSGDYGSEAGVYVKDSQTNFYKNEVTDNYNHGFYLLDDADVRIDGNEVDDGANNIYNNGQV